MKPLIPPPIVALVCVAVMWAVAHYAPLAPFGFPGRAVLSFVLVVLGLGVVVTAARGFRRAGTTVNPLDPAAASALVVGGLYTITRNPMYLGMLTVLFGAFFGFGELLNLFFVAAFVVFITEAQIKPEEAALERKFGKDYLDYKKRVRRWI